jgi:tRNA dimethylallyltransferase
MIKSSFGRILQSATLLCMFRQSWSLGLRWKHSVQLMRLTSSARTARMSSNSFQDAKNLVVVIAGPTGVGKSDVAARLCATEKGIIVSADSVQVYRGVQIGANKPSAMERKATPHILVDVADHTENYNAAEWQEDAVSSIQLLLNQQEDERSQDNPRREGVQESIQQARLDKGYTDDEQLLPVVCGGTMMYLQWLVHGKPDAMRPSESALQKAQEFVSQCQEKEDFKGAVEHVSSLGPVFANRMSKLSGEDWYRLRRTLEVAYTVLDEEDKDELIEKLYSGQREGSLASLGYDVRCFFLCPDDRMSHTRIVDRRCEEMIIRGLIKETADLSLSGCLPDMATRAIGYRQTLDYLQNEEQDFEAYLNDFTTATRRYAKKQMSWFRKDEDFLFVPVSISEEKAHRVEKAATAIQKLCEMSREEYEKERSDETSISIQAKKANEAQGMGMKFYQRERHILKAGTNELDTALAEAIECSNRIQAKKRRLA